jgi:hypothetical protein
MLSEMRMPKFQTVLRENDDDSEENFKKTRYHRWKNGLYNKENVNYEDQNPKFEPLSFLKPIIV